MGKCFHHCSTDYLRILRRLGMQQPHQLNMYLCLASALGLELEMGPALGPALGILQ